ncbi:MAG: TolC family protein [Bacteroidales bacterium]|nr:TolC family protein [Bacteroidales bacterium]
MKFKTLIAITLAAAPAMPMQAQPEATAPLSLKQCMEHAMERTAQLRIKRAEADNARINRREAILAAFTPVVNAGTSAYYNFGRSIDPQTNTYFNTTSFHNGYEISAGIDLFNGFSAVNNMRIARMGVLMAQSEQQQAEANVCLAVMEAYYNVLYYNTLLSIYTEQVGNAEAALKVAQRQEQLGQKGHADVLQMEADLADRRYDLLNMQHMHADQLMVLSDLMLWPLDQPLAIDTTLPAPPAATSSEGVLDFAMEHNPALQRASLSVDRAQRELSTARWQRLPKVGLYAGWSTNYFSYQGIQTAPFANQLKNNSGEYVQLALSIPIWGRMQRQSNVARKRNALTVANAELDQKRRDVESEVRRAMHDRDDAALALQQAQRRAEVQNQTYALNLKRLQQGLISPIEFQTASNSYLKAQADATSALFKLLIKHAVVRYYGGEEYINQ